MRFCAPGLDQKLFSSEISEDPSRRSPRWRRLGERSGGESINEKKEGRRVGQKPARVCNIPGIFYIVKGREIGEIGVRKHLNPNKGCGYSTPNFDWRPEGREL